MSINTYSSNQSASPLAQGRQQGFTLVEVMVALFVLGIGLLGILGMQNNALRSTNTAMTYTQAGFLAHDLFERMRSNRDVALSSASAYYISFGSEPSGAGLNGCIGGICTNEQLAVWDMVVWWSQVESVMINPQAEVSLDTSTGDPVVTITMRFSALSFGRTEDEVDLDVGLEQEEFSWTTRL
jgi:type IV pilus assembly protein PilV